MHLSTFTTILLALVGFTYAAPSVPSPGNPVVFPIILDPLPAGTELPPWVPWVNTSPNLNPLQARSPYLSCDYPKCYATDYNCAMNCANYLKSIGSSPCTVTGTPGQLTTMCQCGNARIDGWSENQSPTTSYCGDVANTVANIAMSCRNGAWTVGDDFCNNNMNMAVRVMQYNNNGVFPC